MDKLSRKWRLLLLAVCTMLFLIFGAAFKLGNNPRAIAQLEPINAQTTNAAVYHFKFDPAS